MSVHTESKKSASCDTTSSVCCLREMKCQDDIFSIERSA